MQIGLPKSDPVSIRYARNGEVDLASFSLGSGPAIVWMLDTIFNHVQLDWQMKVYADGYDYFARHRRLIKFDPRGTGLSTREVADLSVEAQLADIDAVLDFYDLPQVDLFAINQTTPLLLLYTATRPERVRRIIVTNGYANAAEYMSQDRARALGGLFLHDWELWTEMVGGVSFGFGTPESHQFAVIARQCVEHEMALRIQRAMFHADASPYLSRIRQPALVIYAKDQTLHPLEHARALATRMPNARLAIFERRTSDPDVWPEALDTIESFLSAP